MKISSYILESRNQFLDIKIQTFLKLRKTFGQRMHRLLGHGEHKSVGKTLLDGGVGEHAGDEVFEAVDAIARIRGGRAIAAEQFHL